MLAKGRTIDKTFSVVICRADNHKNALALPYGRNGNGFPIVTRILVFLHRNAGKLSTPAERHGNLLSIRIRLESEIPLTVQINPFSTFPIRTRMFRQRNFFRKHFSCS